MVQIVPNVFGMSSGKKRRQVGSFIDLERFSEQPDPRRLLVLKIHINMIIKFFRILWFEASIFSNRLNNVNPRSAVMCSTRFNEAPMGI